jgi:stage II sporulation protein D
MSRAWALRVFLGAGLAAGMALSGARWMPRAEVRAAEAAPVARSTLRVGMWTLWRDREVVLKPGGSVGKTAMRLCERCPARLLEKPVTIRAAGEGVTVNGGGVTAHSAQVWLSAPVTLAAHGETSTLHNPVAITAQAGVLEIVVTLPVESYVERVAASESGPADSMESLKALAIVVRTFALHEAHGHPDYDVCDSTHCQVLHWQERSERAAAAHAATLATAGETLWFHGRRALAYFGKDCGGRTASPEEIWPRARAVPYLPSRADPYCVRDGGRQWASEIGRAELTAALAAHGLARPGWRNLTVARRGESGRAVTLRVDGAEIPAEEFRLAVGESLGWNRIPSTWFEVRGDGERFEFHGRGWGHGVGLCQKGAAVMAAEGRSAQQILGQYFPGAEAADEATGMAWKSLAGDGFVLETLNAADAAYLRELARARSEAFRDATLAPGWVAAFTEGSWIATQPLRTLAARRLLEATLRHEFLHALVEREAGAGAPLWLREGLVEAWSEAGGEANRPPALTIEAVDAALGHAGTEAESAAAHRAAAGYAARLLARYGRAHTLAWLRSGVPAGVVAAVGQR